MVTVGQASTALAYTGPQSVSAGASLGPAAALSSSASACQAGQPVSFTLGTNPATGAAGTYPLESATTNSSGAAAGAPVSTSGWQAGAYTITASYAGTGNCGASTVTEPLVVTTAGLAAAGAGSYPVTGAGTAGFGFIVAKIPHTSSYLGAISLVRNGSASGSLAALFWALSRTPMMASTAQLMWFNSAPNRTSSSYCAVRSAPVNFARGSSATVNCVV